MFVAEYGVGEHLASNDTVTFTVRNVVRSALTWGAAYVLYWETYDNECTRGQGCNAYAFSCLLLSVRNRCLSPTLRLALNRLAGTPSN